MKCLDKTLCVVRCWLFTAAEPAEAENWGRKIKEEKLLNQSKHLNHYDWKVFSVFVSSAQEIEISLK